MFQVAILVQIKNPSNNNGWKDLYFFKFFVIDDDDAVTFNH